jgi:hypothetical protein
MHYYVSSSVIHCLQSYIGLQTHASDVTGRDRVLLLLFSLSIFTTRFTVNMLSLLRLYCISTVHSTYIFMAGLLHPVLEGNYIRLLWPHSTWNDGMYIFSSLWSRFGASTLPNTEASRGEALSGFVNVFIRSKKF